MQKRIHPSTLMRAIDLGVALGKGHLHLIGAVYILGALHHLPPRLHTACRMEDIVIAVVFIELRALTSRMLAMPVEDDTAGRDSLGGIGTKLTNGDYALETSTATGISVHHIHSPIVIP